MLKRWKWCLVATLMAIALVLSVGVSQVDADVCYLFVYCDVYPDGWECSELWICIFEGG